MVSTQTNYMYLDIIMCNIIHFNSDIIRFMTHYFTNSAIYYTLIRISSDYHYTIFSIFVTTSLFHIHPDATSHE